MEYQTNPRFLLSPPVRNAAHIAATSRFIEGLSPALLDKLPGIVERMNRGRFDLHRIHDDHGIAFFDVQEAILYKYLTLKDRGVWWGLP